MSHTRSHIILFLLLVSTLLAGCSTPDVPDTEQVIPPSSNISIGELRRLLGDREQTIAQELIIGGFVTSEDKAGNFYRTFTIEDNTGGVEVMAGVYDLHNLFPMGYYVVVRLQGCHAAQHLGVLQIGRTPKSYSNYPTDYFHSRQELDKHVACYDVTRPTAASQQSIASLNEDMCGRLISISDLSLCSSLHSDGWQVNTEGRWQGYNFFSDTQGAQIAVHTSEYASYCDHEIPTDRVSITGILQRGTADGEEYYMIKMRDESDCQILR